MRVLKDPETRRTEIMDAAERLFSSKGYQATAIIDILGEVGLAKGTFYYYFKSKEEVLDAIIARILDEDVARATAIIEDPSIPVLEKLPRALLAQQPQVRQEKQRLLPQMHLPTNAEMHQKTLSQSVTRLAPLLTRIVEEGIREGCMYSDYPRETIELLLLCGQMTFDGGLFPLATQDVLQKAKAFVRLMELSLGTAPGSFDNMLNLLTEKAETE